MPKGFSREEESLEELVRSKESGTVAVFVGRSLHPGSRLMANRVREMADVLRGLKAIEVDIDGFRRWSEFHHVYGSPCVVLFRNGDFVRRINGILGDDELHALVRRD